MTYLPTMGAIDSSSFNATKFPGTVYATNPVTHAVFVDMQNQLNRAAFASGSPTRLEVDGKLGPASLALAIAQGPYAPFSAPSNVAALAAMADTVASTARARADAKGAPKTVPSPKPASPPMILNTATNSLVPAPAASLTDAFRNMGTPTMIALAVGVVAVGYVVAKDMKKGRK